MCRFKRKESGYIWIEVSGHKYEMKNRKKTKCFILSGRRRLLGEITPKCLIEPLQDRYAPSQPALYQTISNNAYPPSSASSTTALNQLGSNSSLSHSFQQQPCSAEMWAKVTPEGLILYVSHNSSPVFGISPEKLYSRSLLDFIEPSYRPDVASLLYELSRDECISACYPPDVIQSTQFPHPSALNSACNPYLPLQILSSDHTYIPALLVLFPCSLTSPPISADVLQQDEESQETGSGSGSGSGSGNGSGNNGSGGSGSGSRTTTLNGGNNDHGSSNNGSGSNTGSGDGTRGGSMSPSPPPSRMVGRFLFARVSVDPVTASRQSLNVNGSFVSKTAADQNENVYAKLQVSRPSSMQFEMNQLKLSNKRLQDELNALNVVQEGPSGVNDNNTGLSSESLTIPASASRRVSERKASTTAAANMKNHRTH
jgi:hypothetical protein